jgi:hypothetical protein
MEGVFPMAIGFLLGWKSYKIDGGDAYTTLNTLKKTLNCKYFEGVDLTVCELYTSNAVIKQFNTLW